MKEVEIYDIDDVRELIEELDLKGIKAVVAYVIDSKGYIMVMGEGLDFFRKEVPDNVMLSEYRFGHYNNSINMMIESDKVDFIVANRVTEGNGVYWQKQW